MWQLDKMCLLLPSSTLRVSVVCWTRI